MRARNRFIAMSAKVASSTTRRGAAKFRRRIPISHRQMFPEAIAGNAGAQQSRECIFRARFSQRRGSNGGRAGRPERRQPAKSCARQAAIYSLRPPFNAEPLQYCQRRFFRSLRQVARGTHARGTSLRALAGRDQFPRSASIRISCARYSGSENPIPPGYASYKYKFGSKNSFAFGLSIRSRSCTRFRHASSLFGYGGFSPIAVPRSRRSHISSSVATDASACSKPNMPLCRSLMEKGSDSSSARSSVIQ